MALISEAEVQANIKQALEFERWTVIETYKGSRVSKSGNAGGFHSSGMPDLICTHDDLPFGCWLGIEVKRPEVRVGGKVLQKAGAVRPEQQVLADRRRTFIVDDPEVALGIAREFLRVNHRPTAGALR